MTHTTTEAEYAALNAGDAFTWTCAKCGNVQTGTKVFDELPPADAECDGCLKQKYQANTKG